MCIKWFGLACLLVSYTVLSQGENLVVDNQVPSQTILKYQLANPPFDMQSGSLPKGIKTISFKNPTNFMLKIDRQIDIIRRETFAYVVKTSDDLPSCHTIQLGVRCQLTSDYHEVILSSY